MTNEEYWFDESRAWKVGVKWYGNDFENPREIEVNCWYDQLFRGTPEEYGAWLLAECKEVQ